MKIRTIRKGFKASEFNFKPFEKDSKHLNANSNRSKGIQSIRMQIPTLPKELEAFECKFKTFERHSKHSNENSNHSTGIQRI